MPLLLQASLWARVEEEASGEGERGVRLHMDPQEKVPRLQKDIHDVSDHENQPKKSSGIITK